MDRKKWETLVLIVGVLVVAAALALIFLAKDNPKSPLYTNITFAVGFLFYIIYNMISTGGLQKELKDYQSQVTALKEEVAKQRKQIEDLQSEVQQKNQAISAKDQEITSLEQAKIALSQQVKDLQTEVSRLSEEEEE